MKARRSRKCLRPSQCETLGLCAICHPPEVPHEALASDEVLDPMSEAGNAALADLLELGSSKKRGPAR